MRIKNDIKAVNFYSSVNSEPNRNSRKPPVFESSG